MRKGRLACGGGPASSTLKCSWRCQVFEGVLKAADGGCASGFYGLGLFCGGEPEFMLDGGFGVSFCSVSISCAGPGFEDANYNQA
jgi:hypothetical protein